LRLPPPGFYEISFVESNLSGMNSSGCYHSLGFLHK
jgi:hypothetical protein